jgi:hypothetical protein
MSSRTRVKHEISFDQRLANEAQRAREMAVTLPPGKERDALLEKARLVDLAGRINGWLASPELKSQQWGCSAPASHFMGSGLAQLFCATGALHAEPSGCPVKAHRSCDA